MHIVALLPFAFVMIAGPQIITAVFFATSERWRSASALYVLGAALSITAVVGIAYLLSKGVKGNADDKGSVSDRLDYFVLVLLVILAHRVWASRATSEPPKWMGKLQGADSKLAFTLGFLLLGVLPTDLLTSVSIGTHAAARGYPFTHVIPFIVLTLFLVSFPALLVLASGRRAKDLLPKIRDWMNTHSWVVSEVVIVFFIAIVLDSIYG